MQVPPGGRAQAFAVDDCRARWHPPCEVLPERYRRHGSVRRGVMLMERLTEAQKRLLEAGRFRFDGWTHASDVMEAQALITVGYVTQRNIGGPEYTCIECVISDEGRRALVRSARLISEMALRPSRRLMV